MLWFSVSAIIFVLRSKIYFNKTTIVLLIRWTIEYQSFAEYHETLTFDFQGLFRTGKIKKWMVGWKKFVGNIVAASLGMFFSKWLDFFLVSLLSDRVNDMNPK